MSCPLGLIYNPTTEKCENSIRTPVGCEANPCQNGGICQRLESTQFKCECKPGFNGLLCEKEDVCAINSCGSNGICVPLALGSPLKFFCLCKKGQTYGTDCSSTTELNPCIQNQTDLQNFSVKINNAMFVHCVRYIPH